MEATMTTTEQVVHPSYTALDDANARALLGRLHVGRLAFTHRDRVDIEPIHYSFDGEWIFGRTSVGTKLSTLLHHPWCAFEVDEVRGMFDWNSVVVKGTFYLLDPETGSLDTYSRALRTVSELLPLAFQADDPAPHRSILFGIHVNEITGRSARSAHQQG
jgi:nitroimidazol reductase NimA-like FMN-containing flavoprotein (pyridoxamine 5'-phosphate oxidase superfamily)